MTLQTAEDETEEGDQHWLRKMAQQLSGVTVVIIIAGGVLTFLLLFIFAKRQIMRFTLKSHRGPHTPLGYEANKALRREILRRIDAIPKVTYEPQMLREDVDSKYSQEGTTTSTKPCHYYRMKVVDEAKSLEMSIVKKKLGKRHSFESLRSYFIVILTPQVDPRVVHQLCDLYEAARFNPKLFGEEEYKAFNLLLKQLRNVVITLEPKSSVRSPSKSGCNKSVPKNETNTTEEKWSSASAPYIRRLSKKEKSKWNGDEEETALCHSNTLHEVSIISSNKDESTVV